MCKATTTVKKHTIGTLLHIEQACANCFYKKSWDSQPYINTTPAGNVLLSAAILFSGSMPTKALRLLEFLKCSVITQNTFYVHQRKYLQPVIKTKWERQQMDMIAALQAFDKQLIIGGDGRCDSPGFSAKYGTYTCMELEHNAILDIQLVQVSIFTSMVTSIKVMKLMEVQIWRKKGLLEAWNFLTSMTSLLVY